jgi:nucleoside-diphosphate-sugar epimerase
MKILITGSNGFLAHFLIEKFKIKNKIFKVDLPNFNILDFKKINNLIAKTKPGLIIHTAAAKGANKSNLNPKKFIDVNSFGTLNICESMRINRIKKLVYISSCSFYKRKKTEIFEDDSVENNTPYGFGKYMGELIVNYYANKYSLNAISLRPNLITGNKLKEDNLFFNIIDEVLKKNTATVFGKGDHHREFIHPNDIYSAIELWIKKKNKAKFEYYNISNNRYKIIDAVKKTLTFLNKGKIILQKKNSSTFSVKLNCEKIKKELKWNPQYNLDYIIKDNYEAFK